MKKTILLTVIIAGYLFANAQYTMDDQVYDYIDMYKDLAMQEMEIYKIPASLPLAQAIYSSKAGTNRVALEANNHFGITCHGNEWSGETYYETDNHSSDYCFRKYASVTESYRDHSLFLSQRSRYVRLFYYPITDYKTWAQGLKEAGYSGNPRYADTLISIIEKYFLMHYDRKVAQKIGDSSALREVSAPHLLRVDEDIILGAPKPTPQPRTQPSTQPVQQAQPVQQPAPAQQPLQQPAQQPVSQQQPATQPSTPTYNPPSSRAKADTMMVNGIEVIVNKTERSQTPKYDTIKATIPNNTPEKIQGKNVFTLNPYAVPFKSAYYPYTSRPAYENNKTKFIIAKAGDTYKKLAAALQLSEKNLRLYNDVYDESEPIEDEVIYVEMKSTKSPVEYHTLEEGDTYRYIAQKYGIQLKLIIKRNSGAISSYGIGDKICLGCK